VGHVKRRRAADAGRSVGSGATLCLRLGTGGAQRGDEVEDPWRVLGLPEGADPAARREAYRRLAREHHPDRFVAGSDEERAAHDRMAAINAAYRMLSDPNELERFHRLQERRARATPSARPGEDGTHFAAADPARGGGIEPAPGDPDFDYRERARIEFTVSSSEPPPEWPTKKRSRRFWRR
jgi:curved DNA-binding protein CbpA